MKNKTIATASIVSAVLASLCCIGPLVAVGLGLGAFGAATLFESMRPYLLLLTAAILGAGFYLAYRKQPEQECEGGACAVSPNKRSRKIALWIVTAVAVPLAAFPYYSGVFWNSSASAAATTLASDSASLTETVFEIEGMTCAGCAATLESALTNTPGVAAVQVSLETETARVSYDSSALTADKIKKLIREVGFTANERQS